MQVVVERSLDNPQGLTYALEGDTGVGVGDRVIVPLGRGNTPAEGFVVAINVTPAIDPAKIKPIKSKVGVRLPPALIELSQWLSRYYCCPLGMALSTMLPAAVKRGTGTVMRTEIERVEPGERPSELKLTPSAARAWAAIETLPGELFPLPARRLADRIEERTVGPINRLVEAGLLREIRRQHIRAPWAEHAVEAPRGFTLTDDQASAVAGVVETLGTFRTHLLHGVTGSGKTEVYLRILDDVIARGEGAIVLVPEISLTPQTAGRFIGRFEEAGVAVLHSGLTASQRHQQWANVASGAARIVVGARSAVFAPFDGAGGGAVKLGLIVVDEEHDSAYKQSEAPRHHGRDVAIKRAQIEGCPVVLGSATPSLESQHNAISGRSTLHELPERVGGARLPRVEVVDLVEELRGADASARLTLLTPRLQGEIGRALDSGGQVMLLLNRRGYASYLSCADQRCGWILGCEHCDTTMVYHRARDIPVGGLLRCHHCLAEQRIAPVCPMCGSRITHFGAGTQRLEEELPRLFPRLILGQTMLRLDSDTMRRAHDYHEALSRFASGEVRLLLGTQMIAKGLDFPGVTLVGVVNADTAINMPDFRAAERTFQLVSQVAGRAGRARPIDGQRGARVLVQTFNPNEPAIVFAAQHDYKGFASQELRHRADAGLPPIGRLARIVVRDEQLPRANRLASEIVACIRAGADPALRLKGPMPCPISRIAGKHRVAVELLAPSAGPIQSALATLRDAKLVKSDAVTVVDVDPIDLL